MDEHVLCKLVKRDSTDQTVHYKSQKRRRMLFLLALQLRFIVLTKRYNASNINFLR